MTDAQIQTAVRQYRGSDPEHRQNLLLQLENIASRCPSRETREQAIALLPHLVEAEKTIQADAAKVVELERRLQAIEAGMMQPVAYREPVLYSRPVVTLNVTPIAKTGVVVVGIGAAIYFVGVPILAGCAVGLLVFCLVFVAWLRLPTPVRLVPARNGAISFAPHNTPAVVVLGKRFWRDWCQPLLKVVML
jgi:hypothetical protein